MQPSQLVFGALTAALLLNGTAHLHANAQTSDNWIKQAMGRYQSQIWSGGDLLTGTTEFRQARDGAIEGRYTMNEQGKLTPGTLSQCQTIEVRVLRCAWNDKYGTGSLEVTFSEDFSGFNGYWGEQNEEPAFRWDGSR